MTLDNLTEALLAQSKHILGDDIRKLSLEKAIESIVSYYENIIGCMPGNVYWFDRHCIAHGCNKNVLDMFGFKSIAEFKGLTFEEMGGIANWTAQATQSFKQDSLEVVATGTPKLNIEEPPIPHSDGRMIYFLTHRVPIFDYAGKVVGVVGISIDITERKKMEEELKIAKERAEAANQAKTEFLAIVSHELRIPLTGILGMARLMDEEKKFPKAYRGKVKDIARSGEHLLSLINDLLDLAKLEAGKMELHIEPVDMRKQIEQIATMLTPQAKQKKIEFLVDYESDAPNLVIADARAIRQVLLNLAGNALKFTDKGYVRIRVKATHKTKTHANLVFSVEDTGVGIPKDKLQTVFERFTQVDTTTARRYGGTGLGLTISREYLQLMDGKIDVQSTLGKGSKFICTIPFELQTDAGVSSPWDNYKTKVRVLVIDDTLRGEVIYKHIGASSSQVSSGKEAMHALLAAQKSHQPFDVVIIDQQLKSKDSMQLAKEIKKHLKIHPTLLLLLVRVGSVSVKSAAKKAGFAACLNKPTHPTELLTSLTAAWEKWSEQQSKLMTKKSKKTKSRKSKRLHILLVEDDLIIQKVHSAMLEKIGWDVEIAANAHEALDKFDEGYDAILMDVGLPDMNGIECAAEIRKREKGDSHVPIIGLTGYGQESYINNCLKAGMDDVATKPIEPQRLREMVMERARR